MASSGKTPKARVFDLPKRVVAETGRHVPGQEAYLELVRTADDLRSGAAALFATQGLSGKQYNVLRTIRRAGTQGATAGDIQAELVESSADITRLVDRLEAAGLVARHRTEADRREVRVLLTAQGAKVLKALDKPLIDLHVAQFSALSKAEIAALVKLLRTVRAQEA